MACWVECQVRNAAELSHVMQLHFLVAAAGAYQMPHHLQQHIGHGPPPGQFRPSGGLRAVQSSHVLDAYASRNSIAEDEEWPKAQSWDSALTPDQLAALMHHNQLGLGTDPRPSKLHWPGLPHCAGRTEAITVASRLWRMLWSMAHTPCYSLYVTMYASHV